MTTYDQQRALADWLRACPGFPGGLPEFLKLLGFIFVATFAVLTVLMSLIAITALIGTVLFRWRYGTSLNKSLCFHFDAVTPIQASVECEALREAECIQEVFERNRRMVARWPRGAKDELRARVRTAKTGPEGRWKGAPVAIYRDTANDTVQMWDLVADDHEFRWFDEWEFLALGGELPKRKESQAAPPKKMRTNLGDEKSRGYW